MEIIKYVVFFGVMFVGVPFNYIMVKKFPKYEKILFWLLIFFTCNMVDINFVSYEHYRGTARGFEIGMVDILTFSLLAIAIGRRDKHPLRRPPGTFLYVLYFIFSALSLINAENMLFSMFELWKMVRMYIFFYTVYNTIRSFKDIEDFYVGISYVVIFVTYVVLKQKYLMGIFQTYGPFPHQNSMVLYMIIFGSMMLGLVLNKEDSKIFYWLPVFGMAGIDIISALSRAGLATFALAILVIFILSYANKFTVRKLMITLMFLIAGGGVLYKAMDTIVERVETAPEESASVRVNLAIAALNMANDKVLGVGLNNWGIKINDPYPYGQHIPKLHADEKGGLVETIYLMIAAETGWHNLAIFMIFIWYMYFKNLRNYFRMKGHAYRYVPIGLAGGMLAVYLQSALEWVLKQTNNFYELMFVFAVICATSRLLDEEKKEKELLAEQELEALKEQEHS
jgi:hypothetical protein